MIKEAGWRLSCFRSLPNIGEAREREPSSDGARANAPKLIRNPEFIHEFRNSPTVEPVVISFNTTSSAPAVRD
jgi:hypothetical protein